MANRVCSANEMKSITDDVQGIVDDLVKTVGGTWQAALVPRDHPNGKLVNPPRSPGPTCGKQSASRTYRRLSSF